MKAAYSVVFLVFALTLSIFTGDSYAAIPPEGYPRFTNPVTVGLTPLGTDGGFTLTAENDGFGDFSFLLTEGGTSYKVYNGQFSLTADFDKNRTFQTGSLSIYGLLWPADPDLFPPPPGSRVKLFSADLGEADDSQFLATSPNPVIGFRTLYSTFDGWAKDYAKGDESVYLSLVNPDPGSILGLFGSLFNGTAQTVTTVPVPPALLMLASALVPVFLAGRRRFSSAAA